MKFQDFLSTGNLNPGIHKYSVDNFQKQFIDDFELSTTRKDIYSKFKYWVHLLVKTLPPKYMWLDGSFLTTKINPNDIDLVVFYDPKDITPSISESLEHIINGISRSLKCDAYICYCFKDWPISETCKINPEIITRRTYWMGQFGFDRNEQPKGIIELDKNEIIKLGGGV